MSEKPSLLYISPVIPLVTSNGLAMRAGMVLEILAEWYQIHLLVIPLYAPRNAPVPEKFARLCVQTAVISEDDSEIASAPGSRWSLRKTRGASAMIHNRLPFLDVPFDVIHGFRLVTTRFMLSYSSATPERSPRLHLDLDDVESQTHRRLADLYRINGLLQLAEREEAEAEHSLAREDEAFGELDRVYVCSENDATSIAPRSRAEVCVLPNAVRLPAGGGPPEEDDLFSFLFVGSLEYYPNVDAIRYFCTQVLPLIRRQARVQVGVNIVGVGSRQGLTWLDRVPTVHVVGQVPDVAPMYAQADAVVVPVRGGGGTRIKVLEAFAHARPVVSTSIGIEGIDARDGEHVLLADTPEEFARQCLRLMTDPELGKRLVSNAFALVTRAYTREAVARNAAACASRPRATE